MSLESSEVTTYNLTAVSDPEFGLESNNSVLASSADYYITLYQPGMLLAILFYDVFLSIDKLYMSDFIVLD